MILPRLMRVLTLLAVLLAPLTMMVSHASAAPMPMDHVVNEASAIPGHCASKDGEQDKHKRSSKIDCMIMCSAMPTVDTAIAARIATPTIDLVQPVNSGAHGLNPSADPPPPRYS